MEDDNIATDNNGEENIPRLLVIFNHQLTSGQIADAWRSLNIKKIMEPGAELRDLWANMPPHQDNLADCREFTALHDWLIANSLPGDFVLIQGDFGATYLLVRFAMELGIIPIYSTTRRQAEELHNKNGDVDLIHRFRHVKFRRYQPELPVAKRSLFNIPVKMAHL